MFLRKKRSIHQWAVLIAFVVSGEVTLADIVTFERGFSEGTSVQSIVTSTNKLTFIADSDMETLTYAVAERGGRTAAFAPNDRAASVGVGDYFLADERGIDDGLSGRGNYFLRFDNFITSLALDTIDYRTDGGGRDGDTVLLEIFSDSSFANLIAMDSFTIRSGFPDGIVQSLSVGSFPAARSARVRHSRGDIGTAIDNIRFDSVPLTPRPTFGALNGVPEPSSLAVWACIGLFAAASRRLRKVRIC